MRKCCESCQYRFYAAIGREDICTEKYKEAQDYLCEGHVEILRDAMNDIGTLMTENGKLGAIISEKK